MLSPVLYSLYTHDCATRYNSNTIVKFADDTVVVGLITNNDERAYLQEVSDLTTWCLPLNGEKTKEMVVDFCPQRCRTRTPLLIDGTPLERVSSFKYLRVHISEDLSWTVHGHCGEKGKTAKMLTGYCHCRTGNLLSGVK